MRPTLLILALAAICSAAPATAAPPKGKAVPAKTPPPLNLTGKWEAMQVGFFGQMRQVGSVIVGRCNQDCAYEGKCDREGIGQCYLRGACLGDHVVFTTFSTLSATSEPCAGRATFIAANTGKLSPLSGQWRGTWNGLDGISRTSADGGACDAVTGMGLVTSHGIVARPSIGGRRSPGNRASAPSRCSTPRRYRTTRAGQLAELPVPPWRRLRASRLDRASHLLYHATAEALDESGVTATDWDASRSAAALGTTLGGMASGERYHEVYVCRGPARSRPSRVVDHLAHAQPLHLMEEFSLPGVPLVFSNACASGANAVGYSFHLVRTGQADLALCGGYDPLCEFAFAGFHSLQALTSELCRPFDRRRSGLAIGEGAGVLVLEAWHRARARGARILGEVLGFGESNDAFHMTRPDPEGASAARAVCRALQDAGVAPETVDYVNAHGTGTPFNDASETASLLAALGPRARAIPVSSSKSMIGHLLGGAEAVEGILTVLTLQTGWLPPNVNYETPDPQCDLRIVRTATRADGLRVALSNSFGFGGANAVLVFRAVGADS